MKITKVKTTKIDTAAYFESADAQTELLNEAWATGDSAVIAHSLAVIARARGMSKVAKQAGMTRPGLYKALSGDGDPRLTSLVNIMKAIGVSVRFHSVG